jgi:hypothetical protein
MAHLSDLPTGRTQPVARSVPTGRLLSPSLTRSSPLSRLSWQLCRRAAAVLNSDKLRRPPPPRCHSIDRSGTAVPPIREIYSIASSLPASPFASEAQDSGHGDLELALELLGLVHGCAWAWWAGCCVDVSSASSSGSMPSWPRGHCLAMPRWYLQGAV